MNSSYRDLLLCGNLNQFMVNNALFELQNKKSVVYFDMDVL